MTGNPSVLTTDAEFGPATRKLRLVCIHQDAKWYQALFRETTRQGHEFFSAQHAMHGYWLARNESPDAVITDALSLGIKSNYLSDCFQKDPLTANIPVLVLSDYAIAFPTWTELQRSQRKVFRLPGDAKASAILQMVESLSCVPCGAVARNVDAVFSELEDDASPLLPNCQSFRRADQRESSRTVPHRIRPATQSTALATADVDGERLLKQDPPHGHSVVRPAIANPEVARSGVANFPGEPANSSEIRTHGS